MMEVGAPGSKWRVTLGRSSASSFGANATGVEGGLVLGNSEEGGGNSTGLGTATATGKGAAESMVQVA